MEVLPAANAHFPELFKPGYIGRLRLKNRIVMAPMATQFASDTGAVTPRLVDHYRRRAVGGVGLVTVEYTCVDYPQGKGSTSQLSLHDDKLLAGHSDLVDAVHRAGAKISIQLHHAGGATNRRCTEGLEAVGPAPIPSRSVEDQPRILTLPEIEELVEKFARAVERARRAGYDAVELHGTHGYLISQFMSPYINSRTDAFGGSLANRMRFPLEVIARAKQLVGSEYPLTMRISGQEFVLGGRSIEESKTVASILESAGIAALHVSAGVDTDPEWMVDPIYHPQGSKVQLAAEIKKAVAIPVIAVGVIREPAFAERVLREGDADFVAIGRGLLVDPDWPLRAAEGKADEIRRCFSCNYCTGFRDSVGLSLRCVMNPEVGDPGWLPALSLMPARRKKVLVVGGGPAGMEAARVAAIRGHDVLLCEKAHTLGGQLLIGCRAPGKEKIEWLLDDLKVQLDKTHVETRVDTTVSLTTIRALAPDVLILATGGRPSRPDIPGVDSPSVTTAWAVLGATAAVNDQRVVVVGGDSTGCEAALALARLGNEVTLIEQRSALVLDMEPATRSSLLKQIASEPGLAVHTGERAVEVLARGVRVISSVHDEPRMLEADLVVLAIGVTPVRELEELAASEGRPPEVYTIGDCSQPANIAAALSDGRSIGTLI